MKVASAEKGKRI